MTHEEMRDHSGAYVLGALDPEDRERFEAHLAECAECLAEVRSLAPVVEALAHTVPSRQPSSELRTRVVGDARPKAGDSPRGSRMSVVVPWFLAAAAVLALATLTPYTLQLRNQTRELAAAVSELRARLAVTDGQLIAARNEVSLLAAPDVRRVDLRGQKVALQAMGRAFWSPSRGVYFVASDLPPVAADRAYQLWFVTTAGPVSASVFKPDDQGRVARFEPIPPGLAQATAMAVTLEPAGGSFPGPTGDFYLVGPVN